MASFVRRCEPEEEEAMVGGDEKDTLNKLNKRLECYIKRIKDLEDENARLNKEKPEIPGESGEDKESICDILMKIRIDYERKLQKARCLAEKCAEENAKLNQQKNCLLMKLREEEAALKRAEQDAQKLRLTLRFERDVHREELIEICKQSSISNRQYQIQISEKYKSQLNDSLSTLRSQLEDQLRLNHMNFDNQIKSLHVVGTDAGGGAIASIMATQTSLTTIVSQITSLTSQVSECTATVDSLNLQKKYWEQILADDKAQMENLEKTIKELCDKYSKLSEDKSKIQEELGHYSSILKGEESRLGLTDMCLPKLKSKIKPPNQTQSNP